ncbi:MAG TPA: hypothetical protein VFA34_01415 [Actinomycetota bacterium]|nr:hypothetical protein [Actinomycetota bacterium]
MRRLCCGRPFPAVLLVAVAFASVLSACVRSPNSSAVSTPLPEGDDFAFSEILTFAPSSPSPSPSPTLVPVGVGGGSSTSGGGSSAPAAQPTPTSGRVTCPSGTVTATINDFSTSDEGKDRKGNQQWTVRVRGSALNKTSRAIRDIRITVTIHANNAQSESETATIGKWVGQGSTADWGTEFDYESEDEPDEDQARVVVSGWSWGDGYAQCPTHGSTG